jgi:hypothetical protein
LTTYLGTVSPSNMDKVTQFVEENKKTVAVAAGVSAAGLAAAYAWRRAANYVPKAGPYPTSSLPTDAYDGGCTYTRSAMHRRCAMVLRCL